MCISEAIESQKFSPVSSGETFWSIAGNPVQVNAQMNKAIHIYVSDNSNLSVLVYEINKQGRAEQAEWYFLHLICYFPYMDISECA